MKFKEGAWYQFTIEGITCIPEKGDHFVLIHESGRKLLLNAQYYVKYNYQLGDVIECRVDKVNCTGNVFLEPKHPFYNEGESYNFEITSRNVTDDNSISFTVKDCFNNSIQLLIRENIAYSVSDQITLKVEKVKKGIPVLVQLYDFQSKCSYSIGQWLNLKAESIINLNDEEYYSLTDNDILVSKVKVKHYQHYGLSIGCFTKCQVRGYSSDGLVVVEPENPWYKIGESYQFKLVNVQSYLDLEGENINVLIVVDVNGRKCDVKLNLSCTNQLVQGSTIRCKVIGYRKGRPLLEIDPELA